MRLPGQLAAAIEVLGDIEARKRPAADALKDWGLAHRFAGSSDRAAIGNLVYDGLRKKHSLCHVADSASARGLVFGVVVHEWGADPRALNTSFQDDRFAPEPLSDTEISALTRPDPLANAPDNVRADVPEWTVPFLAANFGEDWLDEAKALAERPPLDLRVNTLKSERGRVLKALGRYRPVLTEIARCGLRIPAGTGAARAPNIQAEAGFRKGWFEIQDEGSQIAADLVFARPGEQVLDFCAGAGGKTLALASVMENRGQIFAFDADRHRLAPIYERLKRAGVRNVQVRAPGEGALDDLEGRMDRVLVDAPCSGSGTWRRRPDAKWRLTPNQLEQRVNEQAEVLAQGARYVRPEGFLVYVTCSVLPDENEGQIAVFLEDNPGFELVSTGEVWQDLFGFDKRGPWSSDLKSITLTPAATGTDGFFLGVMQLRNSS
ncbi:MAG: RsmB/NOP family class I SAM-dependent RNA methyltransferase [Alphaproteobacteria bacterium]|nr:RsmB/NOP family class I SAM-dependent RNA methyltransferase [Alphaproteobacteria bacterium]